VPYYITTLVHALGSATRVHATASTARTVRTIGAGPRAGQTFPVEVPTHHSALIEFAGGTSAQSTFSFQHARAQSGFVEINGTDGTMTLPDPNNFDGATTVWHSGGNAPEILEPEGEAFGRGTGVVELARAIRAGEPERASGRLASHVLDILLGISEAAESGAAVTIESDAPAPPPLPLGWSAQTATFVD